MDTSDLADKPVRCGFKISHHIVSFA